MPPPAAPDPRLLGDFFVGGDATLGALAEIYGLTIAPQTPRRRSPTTSPTSSAIRRARTTCCALGPITLVVQKVVDGRAASIGLQLAEPDAVVDAPKTAAAQTPRARRARHPTLKPRPLGSAWRSPTPR